VSKNGVFRAAFSKQSLISVKAASHFVATSQFKSCLGKCFRGVEKLPLTERVCFKTRLQRGNRIQLPKLIRWKYKLEQEQVLKVSLTALGYFCGWESFYARMDKSGRITVPRLTLAIMLSGDRDKPDLNGAVMDVRLEPS